MSDGQSPDCIEVVRRDARWGDAGEDWGALGESALDAVNRAARPARRGEVALLLDDDAALQALNARWRGKDAPTNVLSFPSPAGPLLGDIALSYDTVAREASAQGKSLRDHALHMIVHGLLHLHGFDHAEPGEAERMETLERRILGELGVADPYAREAAHV